MIENNYHFTAQQAQALACIYLSLTPLTVFCKFSIYMSYITILCSDSLGYFLLRSPLLTKDIYIKKEKKKRNMNTDEQRSNKKTKQILQHITVYFKTLTPI